MRGGCGLWVEELFRSCVCGELRAAMHASAKIRITVARHFLCLHRKLPYLYASVGVPRATPVSVQPTMYGVAISQKSYIITRTSGVV